MDLLTTPYVFSVEEAEKMTGGADVLVTHMGLTSLGTIGAVIDKTLDECERLIQEIRVKTAGVNPDILVLCHGGPIAEPKDAEYVLSRTKGVHGFFGASSMERLPVETAIKKTTAEFKGLQIGGGE
jgi:predicted TIM-barrel enzyme